MQSPVFDWSGSYLISLIKKILLLSPHTKVRTDQAQKCAESIGLHLINLIVTASDANLRGCHSVSLSLFRSMEDALDCFAAVALNPGDAEKWVMGKLKPSNAAKVWDERLKGATLPTGERATNYRKDLRDHFNNFAHCSPYLTEWDMFLEIPLNEKALIFSENEKQESIPLTVSLHVNHQGKILPQNALAISAYLCAHLLEFTWSVEEAYQEFLNQNPDINNLLLANKSDLEQKLIENFGEAHLSSTPPELQKLIVSDPTNSGFQIEIDITCRP